VRYLILSDIHANLQALEAVLADAACRGFDHALVLGDLVGYGGDPEAVVMRMRALEPAAIVRGNHDKVCAGLAAASDFNEVARESILWTRSALSPAALAYLKQLPEGPVSVTGDIEICHGSPFDEDFYVFDPRDASRAFRSTSAPVCVFGHTHRPEAFAARGTYASFIEPDETASGCEWPLPPERRVLVNVGSVGQPRDGDPRAAYGLLDTEARIVESRRVEYDVALAQRRIRAAGMPEQLAARLQQGT
jgi:diadenosine tetraphosphatase ApaH/serine/threonine PP2A family protein phosphatase